MIVTLDISNLEIGKIDENGNDVYSAEHMRCFGYIPVCNDNYEDIKFTFNMMKTENDSIDTEKAVEGTVIFYDEDLRILGIKTFTPERMVVDYPRDENDKIYIVKYIRFYVNWINHYKFDFFENKMFDKTTYGYGFRVIVDGDNVVTVDGVNLTNEICINLSDNRIGLDTGTAGSFLKEIGTFMIYDRIGDFINSSCTLKVITNAVSVDEGGIETFDYNLDSELNEEGLEIQNDVLNGYYTNGSIMVNLIIPKGVILNNFRFSPIVYSGFSLNELVIESVPEWELIYDIPENVLHMFTSDFSVNTIIPSSIWNQNDNYNDGIPFLDLLPTIEYTDKHREEERLELLDEVRIISYPHGLDTYLPITRMEITPDKPLNSTYTIGEIKKQTISSRVNKIKK